MSNCNACIHRDRDCVIDPPDGVDCRQYHPSIIGGLTVNEETRRGIEEGLADMKAGRVKEMDFSLHVESENPDHYRNKSVEPIDAMRSWAGKEDFAAYCRLSAIKYLARLGEKDAPSSEAKKAQVYLRWLVETLEGKELSK